MANEQSSASDPILHGGVVVGSFVGGRRFRLEGPIGRGGMGVVWKAYDERLHESVALKFLSDKIRGNPKALAVMQKETSRSHSLSHHHIVRIHDLYETEGEPAFISMEYVDGLNLQQLSKKEEKGAFFWDQVKVWLGQLCAALEYAHSKGVIHRDLKPANLIVNAQGELKLADFGLAEALKEPSETHDRLTGGTLAYMSPQHLSGAPATIADDIYSLGACLHELLCGAPVFSGAEICKSIEFEPATPLFVVMEERGVKKVVPDGIEDLILQCLSKNPQLRPRSATEFRKLAGLGETGREDNVEEGPASRRGAAKWLVPALVAFSLALLGLLSLTGVFRVVGKTGNPHLLDLRNAPAASSSQEDEWRPAKLAFDGIHRTIGKDQYRWVSKSNLTNRPEWISVDLGRDFELETVTIDWELAHAKDFTLRTRTSAEGFTTNAALWKLRGRVAGLREVNLYTINDSDAKDDVVFNFLTGKTRVHERLLADENSLEPGPCVARYVMIHMTAKGRYNPGVFSLYEIEIAAKP